MDQPLPNNIASGVHGQKTSSSPCHPNHPERQTTRSFVTPQTSGRPHDDTWVPTLGLSTWAPYPGCKWPGEVAGSDLRPNADPGGLGLPVYILPVSFSFVVPKWFNARISGLFSCKHLTNTLPCQLEQSQKSKDLAQVNCQRLGD